MVTSGVLTRWSKYADSVRRLDMTYEAVKLILKDLAPLVGWAVPLSMRRIRAWLLSMLKSALSVRSLEMPCWLPLIFRKELKLTGV